MWNTARQDPALQPVLDLFAIPHPRQQEEQPEEEDYDDPGPVAGPGYLEPELQLGT